MEYIIGIIIGVIVLTILVVVHELGHALMARRFGVVVEEFGVGFPPRAKGWKVRKSFLGKNVEYTLNWLPLGGFVKLQGEHDADHSEGDYGKASYWQKSLILLMGVTMNIVAAAVCLTIIAWMGMPKILPNQFTMPGDTRTTGSGVRVARIVEGMPAASAQLRLDDAIIAIDRNPVYSPEQATKLLSERKGRAVTVEYSRDGAKQERVIALRSDNTDKKGYFGASFTNEEKRYSTWSAPIVGVMTTGQFVGATFQGLADMVANSISGLVLRLSPDGATRAEADAKLSTVGQGVTGPVGIFGVLFPNAAKLGISAILMLAAIISVGLAVLNVLPIPALDGGRWFVMTLYRLRNKPLLPETEERIHGIGMMVLLGITIIITVGDVGRFFK